MVGVECSVATGVAALVGAMVSVAARTGSMAEMAWTGDMAGR